MKTESERFIKGRQGHKNYIASRWIPALKIIGPETRYKSGAPKAPPMRLKRPASGGARAARPQEDPKGYIFAVIEKKYGAEGAYKILNDNLERAIREETASKLDYVLDKQVEEGIMSVLRK